MPMCKREQRRGSGACKIKFNSSEIARNASKTVKNKVNLLIFTAT